MQFNRSTLSSVIALAFSSLLVAGCSTSKSQESEAEVQKSASEQQTDTRNVTVLFLADLHAQLEEHPELFWSGGEDRIKKAGGFARMAEAIDRIRQNTEGEVLVVDGGDTIQGSGAAALTEGKAVVPGINEMGIDVAIPGNWSVAYGPKVMKKRLNEQFDHQVVATNVYDKSTDERVFEPYTIRDINGVKVAVIGFTDPDIPTRQPPSYSRGLGFKDSGHLPEIIDEVRNERGADVVLLSSHIGLSKAVAMTDKLSTIDAHLSGDTHERTQEPMVRNDTWIVEPGAFGSFIGKLNFKVKNGEVVDRQWELIEVTAEKYDRDPEVLKAVQKAKKPLEAKLGEQLGRTETELIRYNVIETSLDNMLADALRDATGTDIALSNGFRFGYPVLPGPITQADLWRFYPIVTKLKTAEVTGEQLREFWEQELNNVFADAPEDRFGGWVPRPSGMSVTFQANAPKGERVKSIRVHGEPIEPDETYTITACEREGEPMSTICRIPNAENAKVHQLNAHEAVRQYLQERDSVSSALQGRVDATDLPAVLRTQMQSMWPN